MLLLHLLRRLLLLLLVPLPPPYRPTLGAVTADRHRHVASGSVRVLVDGWAVLVGCFRVGGLLIGWDSGGCIGVGTTSGHVLLVLCGWLHVGAGAAGDG